MEEIEIETVMVLAKRVKLRTINGQIIAGNMQVFECEDPYVMIILVETDFEHSLQMDVRKEDLSLELRKWLEGKHIRNPVVVVPLRIEEAMTRFVKFGKTPLQEDLIMWMLSRSELFIDQHDNGELIFGGRDINTQEFHDGLKSQRFQVENEYLQNSMANLKVSGEYDDQQYRLDDATRIAQKKQQNSLRHSTMGFGDSTGHSLKNQYDSTTNKGMKYGEDQGMFSMTKKLLGKSVTLETIKKGQVKGREGAKTAVVSGAKWNGESLRLCADIEKARKDIEKAMDIRRRMIEVSKTRQQQSSEKFRKIRARIEEEQGGNKFIATAHQELLTLQKIQNDIEDDIMRQKNKAQRGAQKVFHTIAPSAYINRRGKSQRGPVLGQGPLHPNATSNLKDPRVESTMKRFYWDSAGRRHLMQDDESEQGQNSLVDQAMDAIRRAAANVSQYKLDLKTVFREFDTSGDGLLSPMEMAQAFLSMGVKLDIESMNAIFKHFDPNDSGTVHYGEFVWGFFNRRSLVRQWKRKTEGLTPAQITSKFHMADINGDGRLNPKEFKKLLKGFNIVLPDNEIEILIERFDMDEDGDIDMNEFKAFIESEQQQLYSDPNPTKHANSLPVPKGGSRAATPVRGGQNTQNIAPNNATNSSSRTTTAHNKTTTSNNTATHSGAAHKKSVSIHLNKTPGAQQHHQTYPRPSTAPSARNVNVTNHYNGNQTNRYDRPQMEENENSSEDENEPPAYAPRTQAVSSDRNLLEDNVDVLWMSRMLQAQAEVEARLGHRYFN